MFNNTRRIFYRKTTVTTIWAPGATSSTSLAIHGGAGARPSLLNDDEKVEYHQALERSLLAGKDVLDAGGSAIDAVCASVMVMEDSPLFNSAHGAALNADGLAELDASVMLGSGRAGAIAGSKIARNPVLAARAVMERTKHVLLIDPDEQRLAEWGIETVDRDYFITPARVAQLAKLQAEKSTGPKHGTVGAVARDMHGNLAAATSTGGTANQFVGRVGDTPVIGAGTWADSDVVAISCTGQGEYFLRQATAHDIHARMAYGGVDLRTAVAATMAALGDAGGLGGLIALDAAGDAVLVFNSEGMFCGHLENGAAVTNV